MGHQAPDTEQPTIKPSSPQPSQGTDDPMTRTAGRERVNQDASAVKHSLDWLVTDFTERVPDVAHAIVVSSDGVPIAVSNAIPSSRAEQVCAVTSRLTGLTDGAARMFDGGLVIQALVEMERGLMLVKSVSGGSSLAVLATPECDMDLVAYEMTMLVEAVGDIITPATRT
jgi:predicted regulator of Ras-like GTPase activity (Roadblock/LC7/MglB family)